MRWLMIGLWLVGLCVIAQPAAAQGSWESAYREFEGLENDQALFLSVYVTWTPSISSARLTMARWTSESAIEEIKVGVEADSLLATNVQHDVFAPDESFADQHVMVTSLVSEPGITYRVATMFVRRLEVVYVFQGLMLGDVTFARPYAEMHSIYLDIADNIESATEVADLLPTVDDLPYPMRLAVTEIETPVPEGASSL